RRAERAGRRAGADRTGRVGSAGADRGHRWCPVTAPAVRITGLVHRFGSGIQATAAVDGLDLTVAAGEVFGLLGPNGAGKTTTLRVVNTLLPVQEGRVSVFGLDVARHAMAVRRLLG